MIDTKSLRIGNWIDATNASKLWTNHGEGKITEFSRAGHVQVTDISDRHVLAGGYHCLDFGEPIPLSEEVLNNCGFTFSDKKAHFTNGYEYFDFAFDDKNRLVYLSPHSNIRIRHYCDYLHQLQNLYFSLTGEELNYIP